MYETAMEAKTREAETLCSRKEQDERLMLSIFNLLDGNTDSQNRSE